MGGDASQILTSLQKAGNLRLPSVDRPCINSPQLGSPQETQDHALPRGHRKTSCPFPKHSLHFRHGYHLYYLSLQSFAILSQENPQRWTGDAEDDFVTAATLENLWWCEKVIA